MANCEIVELNAAFTAEVVALYRASANGRGGLARTAEEIDDDYVRNFLTQASGRGLTLGARGADRALCGEIHAVRMGAAQFEHVLTDLTVAIHPDWQGRGIGTALFKAFVAAARALAPPVSRIELVAREGNADAIRLYERLGFVREGRFVRRVRLANGTVEDDIPMALLLGESS